jgi:hypothetical protein
MRAVPFFLKSPPLLLANTNSTFVLLETVMALGAARPIKMLESSKRRWGARFDQRQTNSPANKVIDVPVNYAAWIDHISDARPKP